MAANLVNEIRIVRQPKPMRGGPLKLPLTELVRYRFGQGSTLRCPLTKEVSPDRHSCKNDIGFGLFCCLGSFRPGKRYYQLGAQYLSQLTLEQTNTSIDIFSAYEYPDALTHVIKLTHPD